MTISIISKNISAENDLKASLKNVFLTADRKKLAEICAKMVHFRARYPRAFAAARGKFGVTGKLVSPPYFSR